jgi:hypothetical protein
MAGYSQTPLVKKLGIKEDFCCFVANAPASYFDWINPLPRGIELKDRLSGQFDFIHLFALERKELAKQFNQSQKHLRDNGMLWISWPKKASKVPTDLDENIIRDIGLRNGLVDVKVCAVDDVWSGLKFVIRRKDRKRKDAA